MRTTDEEQEGPDFQSEIEIEQTLPDDGFPDCILNKTIYHKYEDGWYPGRVLRDRR